MDQAIVDEKLGVSKNVKIMQSTTLTIEPCATLPLSAFVLVDANPERWEEVEMPADSFNASHETEIHERFVEDVASDCGSEENVEKLVIRLVKPLHSHVKLLIDAFHVCKCLRAWDVHLNHGAGRSRNIF